MVGKSYKLVLLMLVLVFSILISLNFVFAENCWMYGGGGGSTQAECEAADSGVVGTSCVWTKNDPDPSSATGNTVYYDPMCGDPNGCCLPYQCWLFGGQDDLCLSESDTLNCTWDPFDVTMLLSNGSTMTLNGSCWGNFVEGEGMAWGGMEEGCWKNDAKKQACQSSTKCEWKQNDANQNPWCWIKNLFDAQMQNSLAISTDIGCCDQKGCWNYDGNQDQCVNNTAFKGLCNWISKAQDPWCPNSVGCCMTKWCGEITDETNCTKLKTDLMMPCTWNNGSEPDACEDYGGSAGGGFIFFNDTDSCMGTGGWWNGTDCEMPSGDFAGGAGGFMFGEDAHCWFADNQPNVCMNITGCIYCNDTGTHFNVTGKSGTNNESSACYNRPVGFCQGHQYAWTNPGASSPVSDIETDNLNCTHIQIKSACEYGPLPNCVWKNTTSITGAYCEPGTSSTVKSAPPVTYCEDSLAKNNYTLCTQLIELYMMPCKWADPLVNFTNCTFNSNAVFGTSDTKEKDYEVVTSETSCVAAGGTWKKEYYVDNSSGVEILKQDQWCEKGALYNLATGTAVGNKGSCDSDCWACEFNSTGGNYGGNVTLAETTCLGSVLGYCVWTNYTGASNGMGWCDYPNEMSYGAGDCQTNCKDCGLMQTPYTSCINSQSGCKWVNDSDSTSKLATGVCVDQAKKTCDTDCFSCYDFQNCNASSINCKWDDTGYFCKPATSENMEICFDGMDNDGDNMMDCADPDCSFDMACGGSAFGDCSKYDYSDWKYDSIASAQGNCTDAIAFGNSNCTWINMTWEDVGHCGMPGEDCWMYDNNMTLCGLTTGCTNSSTTSFSNFCDINMTRTKELDCWQYKTNATCSAAGVTNSVYNCTWVAPEWGEPFCDYNPFAVCMGYAGDQENCDGHANCFWNTEWNSEGFCDVACFNFSHTETQCNSAGFEGICEWKNSSNNMCMPNNFDMMGGGTGAKSGCAQYDGNYSACIVYNNITCTWHNDTTVDNNVSDSDIALENIDGWCDSKGEYELNGDMKGDIFFLGFDSTTEVTPQYADIEGFGMRTTGNAYGFGIGIYNITDAAICNGYNLNSMLGGGTGTGLNTTKFYWYLDTDGNSASNNHCNATNETQGSVGGFEFYISYVIRNNTNTGSIETTKQLYRCIQNSSVWQWVPTNVFVSDNKKFTCFETGRAAFVTVEKTALENFPDFNMTVPMRIFATSADSIYNRTAPLDSVGPAYYTPGTVDFAFVDCSDPNVKDSKCKNFQKFGVQMFEDCKNNVDDDGDGLADCNDPKCAFTPVCASGTAFNFIASATDNQAPIVMFTKVDKMADSAIVIFDTDEPANGTLIFYNQSSTCTLGPGNATLNDLGDDVFTFDDYKPYHRISLDSSTLGYDLVNSTTHFYKLKVCDPSNNCGISACLNFTTKKVNKEFIFRLDLPTGFTADIPSLNYTGNFTHKMSDGGVYDIGIKTNTSNTKNMNITINYSDMSLKFVGVDVYKPKSLDLENAFIIDTTNDVLGMNSSTKAWNTLLSDLGLGGAGDSIELNFPVTYNVNNSLIWHQDNRSGTGNDVDSYTNCSAKGTGTVCKIPTSLGFSVYQISVPSTTTTPPATTTGSAGSSNITITTFWSNTYVISDTEFETGFSKDLASKQRVKVSVGGESHYVGIVELTSTHATINVSSSPMQVILGVGNEAKFDVTNNGYYDVYVKLENITGNNAKVYIKKISEEIPEGEGSVFSTGKVTAEGEEGKLGVGEGGEEEEGKINWLWIVIGALVVIFIVAVFIIKNKRR